MELPRCEADAFYAARIPAGLSGEERSVARQAYSGLLWSKQFYHYVVPRWLEGDPAHPAPPHERKDGRNRNWPHIFNRDVISMPDKWEYPWYAAWDLAFHMVPFSRVDPAFAKEQLTLFLRECYMHPSGQIPTYKWNLSDVNPPVHAWTVWRTYKKTGPAGHRDREFLAASFQKLLVNFTWWVNRKDVDGRHVFSGGSLGLDNIGILDRSSPLPTGGHLEQADGTAWMAFYAATMLAIALELAKEDPAYDGMASKFLEHFVAIVDAMNGMGETGLWDEQDGFYYDQVHAHGRTWPLRTRSMVGLIPLLAVEVLDESTIETLPGFARRMKWYLANRRDITESICFLDRRREPWNANDGSPFPRASGSRASCVTSSTSGRPATRRRNTSITSTASEARIPRSRLRAAPTRIRRSPTSHGSNNCTTTSRASATSPSKYRSGSESTNAIVNGVPAFAAARTTATRAS